MTGVLVHEWIAQAGGSENVLNAMNEVYPDADVLCLWNDSDGRFDPARVKESWLARTPLRHRKALALPFMPATWRLLPYRGYDWALISSHLFAHHAHFRGQPAAFRKYVYVHTPARYIWSPELDTRGSRLGPRLLSRALMPLDRRRAGEGASFAANSDFVRRRVRDAWGVDARVIYPPVAVEHIMGTPDWRTGLTGEELDQLNRLPADYLLGASRFVPYKRLDLVIAAGEAAGRPVVLAGRGPELTTLRAQAQEASVPVHIVESPSEAMLYSLYQQAALYVFPAVEDFGIMPVEALAAGAPVLAQAVGGTSESVVQGRTGALTDFSSAADIREGVEVALASRREDRLARARDFAATRFATELRGWVGT